MIRTRCAPLVQAGSSMRLGLLRIEKNRAHQAPSVKEEEKNGPLLIAIVGKMRAKYPGLLLHDGGRLCQAAPSGAEAVGLMGSSATCCSGSGGREPCRVSSRRQRRQQRADRSLRLASERAEFGDGHRSRLSCTKAREGWGGQHGAGTKETGRGRPHGATAHPNCPHPRVRTKTQVEDLGG